MENTGIIRKIDNLGRIVIPKEIRNTLRIRNGNDIEISMLEDKIILNKVDSFKTDNMLKGILTVFSNNYHVNVILTSLEEIKLYHLINKNNLYSYKLGDNIITIIEKRQKERVTIENLLSNQNDFIIIPLIVNGDVKGSIIVDYSLQFSDDVKIKVLIDILKMYLE